MKKLLLWGACLWALAGQAQAQTAPPALVVVRIYEGNTVTAIITRGEGKSEKVAFANGATVKNLTRTSEGYYKLFAQLYAEGYVLQSTMSAAANASSDFLTLLFVKK